MEVRSNNMTGKINKIKKRFNSFFLPKKIIYNNKESIALTCMHPTLDRVFINARCECSAVRGLVLSAGDITRGPTSPRLLDSIPLPGLPWLPGTLSKQ